MAPNSVSVRVRVDLIWKLCSKHLRTLSCAAAGIMTVNFMLSL